MQWDVVAKKAQEHIRMRRLAMHRSDDHMRYFDEALARALTHSEADPETQLATRKYWCQHSTWHFCSTCGKPRRVRGCDDMQFCTVPHAACDALAGVDERLGARARQLCIASFS